jgi:hypothetical protein
MNNFGGTHEQPQIIDLATNSKAKKEINFFIGALFICLDSKISKEGWVKYLFCK